MDKIVQVNDLIPWIDKGINRAKRNKEYESCKYEDGIALSGQITALVRVKNLILTKQKNADFLCDGYVTNNPSNQRRPFKR